MSRRGGRRHGAAALLLGLLAAGCETPEQTPEADSAADAGGGEAAAEPAADPPSTGVLGRPAADLLVAVEAGTGRVTMVPKPPEPGPEPVFAVGGAEAGSDAAGDPGGARRPGRDSRDTRDPEAARVADRAFAEARRDLGLALERVGDIPGAVSELEAAVGAAAGAAAATSWPRDAGTAATPWEDLARICRRGEPAEAVARACSAAIASNRFAPATLAELLAHRGDAVAELGRARRALADYEAALKIESTQHSALIGRARLRLAAGATARALNDLRLAIATGPRPAEARLARARAYEALGGHERAVADYDAVLADAGARPWHPAALRGRAAAHCALGRAEAAAADWRTWADSTPDGAGYLQEMLRARGHLRASREEGLGEATLAGLGGWTAAGCP